MKKISSILGSFALVSVMLTSCGGSKEESSANSNETTSAEVKSETTGSSDCDKFVKDYEDFVNKYIEIYKKYKADPTDQTILTEYTELAGTMEKWQSNAANCTDSKYTTKLVEIATKMTKAISE